MAEEDYQVRLDIFEGPLDLLLHLIRKNEVDITDIPISLITAQFLEYVEMMQALNLTLAGEYLLMAATLVNIKSRMLVPRLSPADDEDDPRQELIRPLMEYMTIREAARVLDGRPLLDRDVFVHPPGTEEVEAGSPDLVGVGLFDLIDAFRRVMAEREDEPRVQMPLDRKRLTERMDEVLRLVTVGRNVTFDQLFEGRAGRADLVLTFLAILELVRRRKMRVFQNQPGGVIRLRPASPPPDDRGETAGEKA
ncbi:MAG: segregation/condensation protein A [Proteobacteria bacterium]|nr:segregation/condensation protein A [Pseudomonadota bacterium]